MKRIVRLIRSYWEILGIGILSLTPLWWLRGGTVLFGHDSGFRFGEAHILNQLFYTWNPVQGIGTDWSILKAFLITQMPEALSISLFSFEIGEKIALVFWFFIIGFCWWLAMKILFPEKDHIFFRMWVSIFAMFNFYILQGWFIAERAKFSLFAALPLFIVIMIKTYSGSYRILQGATYAGLLFFFLNGGGSPPLYGALIITSLIIGTYVAVQSIRERNPQACVRIMGVGIASALITILCNAYWIIPQIVLAKSTYSQSVAGEGGIEGLISWEKEIGKNSSIWNLIRLQGIPDWFTDIHAFSSPYLHNPILIAASCVPIFLVIVGLLWRMYATQKREKHMFFTILLMLIPLGLFFTAGSHPPTGELYLYLMRHIPGFAIFRSSFYKFAPSVWLPIIMLSGYVLGSLLSKVRHIFVRNMISIAFCLGIILYHAPYFVSDFFTFLPGFSTRLAVPSYVKDAANSMSTLPTKSRVLLVPQLTSDFYGTRLDAYDWGYFSLDILPRNISHVSIVTNDKTGPTWLDDLYEKIAEGKGTEVMHFIRVLGITHILYREDVRHKSSDISLPVLKKNLLDLFGTPVWQSGKWMLFAVSSSNPQAISISASYRCGMVSDAYGILISSYDYPIAESCQDSDPSPLVIQPTCLYCKQDELEKTIQAASILPIRADWLSVFLRRRKEEKALRDSKGSNPKTIDVLLSIAQHRLGEMHKSTQREQLYKEYDMVMREIEARISSLDRTIQNSYRGRVLAYLDAHYSYLDTFPELHIHQMDMDARIKRIMEQTWMGDGKTSYRMDFYAPRDMQASLIGGDDCSFTLFDGNKYPERNLLVPKGYHTMELVCAKAGVVPKVAFVELYTHISVQDPFVTVRSSSPTKYSVHITNMRGPFLLELQQKYHPGWTIQIASSTGQTRLLQHTSIDGYANGWIIDGNGSMDAVIEFIPQRFFLIGAAISLISLAGCIYLLRRYE